MDEKLPSKRYEPPVIELENHNNSHSLLIQLVGFNKSVLEIGTSTGYVSKILKERGNRVIGIEADEEAGLLAGQFCDRILIGDIEEMDLEKILGTTLFDVILCGDVLEHLKQPGSVIKKLREFLKPGGFIAVSVPNFFHGDVLLNLLMGDFHYTSTGLLDETHIRFFGLKNICEIFSGCGFQIRDLRRTHREIGTTELGTGATKIPRDLLKFIRSLPDSSVYQYVFAAYPSENAIKMDSRETDISALFFDSLQEYRRELQAGSDARIALQDTTIREKISCIEELERRSASKDERIDELEQVVASKDGQIEEMTGTIRSFHTILALPNRDRLLEEMSVRMESLGEELAQKDRIIQEITGDVRARAMEGAIKDRQIQDLAGRVGQLEQKIASIENSIVWQLTMKFHAKGVTRLLPPNTRRRKYYDMGIKGGRILVRHGPKPFFSAVSGYLTRNARKKQEALRSRHSKYYSGEVFRIDPSEFLPLEDMKIAVHAHVFYIDLFEEICRYLNNIPVKYTLLVSVTRSEDKKIILEKVKTLACLDHVEVRVVENRGRDIAPFLVEFGPSLRKFDYICHIHTKKSLFTGEEKTDWRQYLFDRLLGSSDMVRAIFTAFKRDPSIGIIYPEIYPLLPYQACTWLSNKHTGRILSDKLNIRFDPDEYLDFPAGSMFWIRKESLEPILDLKLNLHDFPEELGQNDGALQHTLERCFVLAAQSRDFWYLVIRDPSNLLFSYKSHRNLAQYLGPSFESSFLQGLKSAEIVSFDIFDTLLFRPFATPDMVYSYLEEIVEREFRIPRFKDLRIRAESVARERKNYLGDVKISEIYLVFSELAGIDSNTAETLLNLEVETEKKLLIPRKDLVNSANYAKKQGKRLILVSDTYFERKNVEEMLFSKGIDCFDEIYLSSETGKRKDRGDLWEYVFEREGITPDNFMHIGDNEESDVQRIGDKGFINKVHVMRPTALFRQSSIGARLWDGMIPFRGWRENLLFGKIANRLCSDPNQKQLIQSRHPFEDPYVFGYIVFGPIIFNFINWLIKESTRDRCEHLWFVAREGYLLKDAFDLVATHPDLPDLEEKLPTGRYFLCSRRTAVFAMLNTERDIPRLMEGKFRGTLRDFFTRRLCISTIAQVEVRLGSGTLDREISLPEEYDSIYQYVKQVLDVLAAEAQTERELLLEYCNAEGFLRSRRIGIVDMGYSGTAQSALAELLNSPIDGYYFVTETKALELARFGSRCRSCFAEYVDPYDKKLPIHRYSLLLEAILTAPTGQVIRFERDASAGIVPVFKEWGVSQHQFQQIHRIHEGILQFIAEMIEEFGPAALEIEFPNDLVQLCYELVIEGDFDPASLRTALSVEDEYCGNDEISPLDLYRN